MNRLGLLSVLSLLVMVLFSCKEEGGSQNNLDGFDRKAMLSNWADNYIIPALAAYRQQVFDLDAQSRAFAAGPDSSGLMKLREAWRGSYMAWQRVSLFEIGKAEALSLRDFCNTFPPDTALIRSHATSGTANLELPSNRASQGLPALDYLLFGTASDWKGVLDYFKKDAGARDYLQNLSARLLSLADEVLNDWSADYRNNFIENSGQGAGSSVNRLVNDFMFYYEKHVRAGKVGIPAGVFSSMPLANRTEAFYADSISNELFRIALQCCRSFFNGTSYDGNSDGPGLADYLDHLQVNRDAVPLSQIINKQFDTCTSISLTLLPSFGKQVETDNQRMLSLYDALQQNVVLLKVDMMQALNIKVDFVDADGD